MSPSRAHVFVPDPELPADQSGRRFGRCCPLPEDNRCHHPPARPPDDWSTRALGEHDLE